MGPRIAVVGAGAIGSSVAADLTKAGHDVTVIDQWPAHVEVIRFGVTIEMPAETLRIPLDAYHVHQVSSLGRTFDLVFLAVKSNDTRWMTELIRPYLAADGALVGLQNGMNNDAIASIVGRERTIGSVVELSAEIFVPGVVQRDTDRERTWFGIGELDGSMTPRLDEIQAIMRSFARVDVTDSIESAKWTKLVMNSMTMGPFGLFGVRNWDAVELPGILDISVRLGKETVAVGQAMGLTLSPIFGMAPDEFAGSTDDVIVRAMRAMLSHIGQHSTTAPIHDHKKRRMSEIPFLTGVVVEQGRRLGVPTPYNEAVRQLDQEINEGRRRMGVDNLDALKERIATLA
jgi:2-dehydropantoate 2-reductase